MRVFVHIQRRFAEVQRKIIGPHRPSVRRKTQDNGKRELSPDEEKGMFKTIRGIVLVAGLLFVLGLITPAAAVRADDQQDYNAYWQDQQESLQQEQTELQQQQQDYNAYWQEMQEIQQRQQDPQQ
jgi:Tfp pilus assembly protein PilN